MDGGKKTTYTAKADKKKGGLGRRNAHNDAANSRKRSALHDVKNDSSVNVSCIEKDHCSVKKKSSKALCEEVGVVEKICIPNFGAWFRAREEEEVMGRGEYEEYVNGYGEDELTNLTALDLYPVTHEKLLSHLEKLKTEM
ncbi:hypothetical protein OROMI_017619 [Orobanche minor]